MLNYSNTINHELFNLKLIITTIKVYNLINPFSLNFYIISMCNFSKPLYIKVTRLIFKGSA
jgi:hypothetical protein